MKQLKPFYLSTYVEDTDFTGVVYHANYLKYMERSRSEWLYSEGFDEKRLLSMNLGFAVRTAKIEYMRPARLGYRLRVELFVKSVKKTSLVLFQQIFNEANDELLCEGELLIVALNLQEFKPMRIPDEMRCLVQLEEEE
jgi:tol-pal system-associated acyl-CoA thioesterase